LSEISNMDNFFLVLWPVFYILFSGVKFDESVGYNFDYNFNVQCIIHLENYNYFLL
jgi:hypothetical protein